MIHQSTVPLIIHVCIFSPSLSGKTSSPLINSPCQSPESSLNDSPVNSRPDSPMVSTGEPHNTATFEVHRNRLGGPRGRVDKSAISLPHLAIPSSHRCFWCGFEPRSGHVRQAKFCLRVYQVGFLGVPFLPHLLIGPSHMS